MKLEWSYTSKGKWIAKSDRQVYKIDVTFAGWFWVYCKGVEKRILQPFDTLQAAKEWCQARENELEPERPLGLP